MRFISTTILIVLLFAAPALAEDAGVGTWARDAAGTLDCAERAGADPAVHASAGLTTCYHTFTSPVNVEPIRLHGSKGRICVAQISGATNPVTVYMMDHRGATTDAEAQPIPGMTGWTGSDPCKDLPGNGSYYVTVAWTSGSTRVSVRGVR